MFISMDLCIIPIFYYAVCVYDYELACNRAITKIQLDYGIVENHMCVFY